MSGTSLSVPSPKRAWVIRGEKICDRFEAAWNAVRRGHDRPCLEDFLAEAGQPEHLSLLPELLEIELDYRRRIGERPAFDEYRPRFPALSASWFSELLLQPATLPFLFSSATARSGWQRADGRRRP